MMRSGTLFEQKPFVLIILMVCSLQRVYSAGDPAFRLSTPSHGVKIANNVPVFSWHSVDCQKYHIWIDGLKIDSVMAPRNWYIPFPLSFGKHRWHVDAVMDKSVIPSDTVEFMVEDKPLTSLPDGAVLLRHDWKVISSVYAGSDGSGISSADADTHQWKPTSLPATVLSVMVRNGLYPNPYLGLNNMRIPDLSDEFNAGYDLLKYSHIKGVNPWKDPYWFRREFEVPPGYKDKKIWLTLGEINYRAEVWINGHQLADTSEVVGMERSFRFDITPLALPGKRNILAIAIYPPDHPGMPAAPPLSPLADPGTNMADGMLSRDYTRWDVLGWDWIPAIRDRDMGITEDVFIHATDAIELDNLYVTANLPLPDTSWADITISADLINHSDRERRGSVRASISGESHQIVLEEPFTVGPNDTVRFFWDKENMPQLHLQDPRLWWPSGYGRPDLYDLTMEASAESNEKSVKHVRFGIREVETYIGPRERVYRINGRDIYCRGGNWVLDMMLNWTAGRYEKEIRLTRDANLNMLRIWGPTGAPPEVFYDAADEYGILLWQDFLNDFWGTFRNKPGYRPEESLFEKATISITKRYRNHPSLVIWSSGNEGPNPREDLIVNKVLPAYDGRDSRHYLRISNGDGLHGGGPYHTLEPSAYFTDPKLNGFSSEIGPSGVPVFESVIKFMPDLGRSWMPGRYPLDGVWAYHDANDWPGRDLRKFSSYDNIIRNYYGPTDSVSITDAEEYLARCQLLNWDVYRASIEAISSQLWESASGILLWKSNASWPSMTWQIYDWFLQAHAGYYGTKKAAAPISVHFNRNTKRIGVVNATCRTIERAVVSASLFGGDMSVLWNTSETMDLQGNSAAALKDSVPVTEHLCFLNLKVRNQQGKTMADNFYWLSNGNHFKGLKDLPEPELTVTSKRVVSEKHGGYEFALSNNGHSVALMTELKLVDPVTNLEVLPSFWTDNYVSLLPGETRVVRVEPDSDSLPGEISLVYKAYNMKKAGMVRNLK
jgi:hypothetical protein